MIRTLWLILRKKSGCFYLPGGQPFRFGQDDVSLNLGLIKGWMSLAVPRGAAVFHTFAVLPGVLAFDVHRQSDGGGNHKANKQVLGVEARQRALERGDKAVRQMQQRCSEIRTDGQLQASPALVARQKMNRYGRLGRMSFFTLVFIFPVLPCCAPWALSVTLFWTSSLNLRSLGKHGGLLCLV